MSNKNKNTHIGSGAVAAVLIGLSLLVGQCKDKGNSPADDMTIKIIARERLEAKLKDPGSLEIIDEKVIRPGKYGRDFGYWCKYRAKNSFGGYVVEEHYDE